MSFIDSLILAIGAAGCLNFIPQKLRLIIHPVMLFLAGFYLLISVIGANSPQNKEAPGKTFYRIKTIIIWLLIISAIIVPTLYNVYERHIGGINVYAHDGGVIHTKEAMMFLLKGENPYKKDYFGTELEKQYLHDNHPFGLSSIIYHYPYLPLSFLLPIPFYFISAELLGWFDMRFVYLAVFILSILTVQYLSKKDINRLLLLIIIGINPIFSPYLISGRNDFLVFFFIICSILLLKRNNILIASAFYALAFTIKPTAWLLFPLYFNYLYLKETGRSLPEKVFKTAKKIIPFFLIVLMVIVPFFLWDSHSFKEDIFDFNTGKAKGSSYPLGGSPGFGFSNLFVMAGYGPQDYVPFWIFQALFCIPILLFFLRLQKRKNSINTLIILFSVLLFFFLYFSRFFHNNYIGFTVTLLFTGALMDEEETGNG